MATQVTIGGSSTIPGTIYAPGATVNDNDQNGLNGGIIAAAYAQGGLSGSLNGGQVQAAPFAGTIKSCSTPQLTIALSAGTSTAVPVGTVHYTVSVTNSGSAAYSAATFTDSLPGVLDDATYNSDASASAGSVQYTSPNLTWTGSLAVGATATITFSVTVNNPDTGDKSLVSTVSSTSTGSNCAAGSTDSRCSNTIPVEVQTMAVTASPLTTAPGATVNYAITVTNSGTVAVTGAALTDSLSGVLDDAAYNGDATATAGSVTYSSPSLTWTGNLAAGAVATITFSVTVSSPDTGNKILTSTITSATGRQQLRQREHRRAVRRYRHGPGARPDDRADRQSRDPHARDGGAVHHQERRTPGRPPTTARRSPIPCRGCSMTPTYNGDATATAGSVTYPQPRPDLDREPRRRGGGHDHVLGHGDQPGRRRQAAGLCHHVGDRGHHRPAGSTDSRCASSIKVLVPGLAISVSAGASTTTPGGKVQYTVTAADTGGTAYRGDVHRPTRGCAG